MSETISKIKKDVMQAKLANRNLPCPHQQIKVKALTSFLGELERDKKIDEYTEEDVIIKLKKISSSLKNTGEEYHDISLIDEARVLDEYCPKQLTVNEIEKYLQDIDFGAVANANAARGIAFRKLTQAGVDKSQYESADVITVVEKLFKEVK